jgi:hypothetical protein
VVVFSILSERQTFKKAKKKKLTQFDRTKPQRSKKLWSFKKLKYRSNGAVSLR